MPAIKSEVYIRFYRTSESTIIIKPLEMQKNLIVALLLSLAAMTAALPSSATEEAPTTPPPNPNGRLRFYARFGKDLLDKDGCDAGGSDPYVEVVAYDESGNRKTLRTRTDENDESPEWFQMLDFSLEAVHCPCF